MTGRPFPKGNRAAKRSLSDADVLDILRRAAEGESQASLAREYKASSVHIGRIVRREIRQSVRMPEDPQAALKRLLDVQEQVERSGLERLEEEVRKTADGMISELEDQDDRS